MIPISSSKCVLSIATIATVVGALILLAPGCRRDKPADSSQGTSSDAGPWFEEVAAESGVTFEHVPFLERKLYAPEIIVGGVGLLDYDNDGDLDIYFVQSGDLDRTDDAVPGNQLFRNRGDGTFEDVTALAGVGDKGYGMGCTCADYDRDGDVDIYVSNVGPNVLYRNNGDGTFTDVTTAAGVGDPGWSASCAFLDYNGDDFLDLFVTNYLNWSQDRELVCRSATDERDYCSPKNYQAPAWDALYRNNGDGTFVNVSEAAGLRKAFGNGLGVATGDFNGDGSLDIYVANDAMENQLWLGSPEGLFTNRALLFGCALSGAGSPEAGMGVMAVDAENDGDLDLFLSHLRDESNTFYLNSNGMFDDTTARMGLASTSLPYTGFGLGFADFDHDGMLDVFVANGRVNLHQPSHDPEDRYAEPDLLLRGRMQATGVVFEEVKPQGGTTQSLIRTSRAAAFGDLDQDGDVDIVVVNIGEPAYVLRNLVGTRGQWVIFRVVNRFGTDAIGATVRITSGGQTQYRTVQTAYSYCASNDPRVHFGLGKTNAIDEVVVRWPGGKEESFGARQAGTVHELVEGKGTRTSGG